MICQTRNSNRTISIFISEEQEFYRQIYQASFENNPSFCYLGISSTESGRLLEVLANEKPEVLLIGAKRISDELFQALENIAKEFPRTSLVILLTTLNKSDSKLLRKIVQKNRSGIAVYMKQSLDNFKQLHDIIRSVSHGQVILDPEVANSILMENTEYPFMKLLTDREMEILNFLAQGHTNHGIASLLFIDVKTVAHHLNNIYSKFKEDTELNQKHPRVSVARLYLETTGELMPFNSRNSVSVYPQ
ncbi:MAG TPA: response regulator transcription factor [Dehalococcoidales bacterium]|nr:response regulator transcription factor [Dehalococcoidales bacterium]